MAGQIPSEISGLAERFGSRITAHHNYSVAAEWELAQWLVVVANIRDQCFWLVRNRKLGLGGLEMSPRKELMQEQIQILIGMSARNNVCDRLARQRRASLENGSPVKHYNKGKEVHLVSLKPATTINWDGIGDFK